MKSTKSNNIKTLLNKELKNKTILITGGAGSIGAAVTKKILEYPVKSVRVLDISEYELFRLKRSLNDHRVRFLLGSVLDKDRLEMACKDAEIIIHMAAIKNLEITEYNPIETVDTNINGTINLIKVAIKNKPLKFLNISTDKAVESSTLYGTTKQVGERITSWAGAHILTTKFASIRFGNVFETRGNVFEIWNDELRRNKPLSITVPTIRRYFIHINEAVDIVLQCLLFMNRGEIFVPKMKSFNIKDFADKISKHQKIMGLRQGEKMEELLISEEEKRKAKERKNMWIIRQYVIRRKPGYQQNE